MPVAVLHGLALRRADGSAAPAGLGRRYVHDVDAPGDILAPARTALGERATAEALAVELRRRDVRLDWAATTEAVDAPVFARHMERWGRESVHVVRRDPTLLPELQIGSWFAVDGRTRVRLRAAVHLLAISGTHAREALLERLPVAIGPAGAFWVGVRAEATEVEWRRMTRGYPVLVYHRLAGADVAGQERVDVAPERFHRDMALLRALRFHPLEAHELCRFHAPAGADLGSRRRCVITVDDAFADVVEPLGLAGDMHPQLFVPTGDVGRRAAWLDEQEVADWQQLLALRRLGVTLGSHTRTHASLPDLPEADLRNELEGSRHELKAATGELPSLLAYPYGRSNERVRAAAAAAGYTLAYTTEPGLNGAGSDRYSLRRVSVKQWDTRTAVLWKLLTGSPVPSRWERWLVRRHAVGRLLRRARRPPGHLP